MAVGVRRYYTCEETRSGRARRSIYQSVDKYLAPLHRATTSLSVYLYTRMIYYDVSSECFNARTRFELRVACPLLLRTTANPGRNAERNSENRNWDPGNICTNLNVPPGKTLGISRS